MPGRLLSALLVLLSILAACGSFDDTVPVSEGGAAATVGPAILQGPAAGSPDAARVAGLARVAGPVDEPSEVEPEGLSVRLDHHQGVPTGRATAPPDPVTTPLDSATIERLLARLPPLPEDSRGEATFALPPASLPAPSPGGDLPAPFPPTASAGDAPDVSASISLAVDRFAPEGEVLLAPSLNLTFSQPMVPLTSQGVLSARDVPVRLEPAVDGSWRWVGTRTLVFEPEPRFAMATRYRATVPLGTTSATGGRLTKPLSWSFATPPVRLTSSWPTGGPHARQPLIFLGFDQAVDAEVIAARVELDSGFFSGHDVRRASAEEIEADATVSSLVDRAEPGRFVVLTPVEPLPLDTGFDVVLPDGTPSAEGPRTTERDQGFEFRTYGAMRLLDTEPDDEVPPGSQWSLEFSNPIAEDEGRDGWISIEPALPGLSLRWWGDTLYVSGEHAPRTSYALTLSAALRDTYGQTLGAPRTVTFDIGPVDPGMAARSGMVVADPQAPATYPISTRNLDGFEFELRRVTAGDWAAFGRAMQQLQSAGADWPGEVVSGGRMMTGVDEPDVTVTTLIDLAPALQADRGHVIVLSRPLAGDLVEPGTPVPDPEDRGWWWGAWIQRTGLAVDAFSDQDDLVVWTNSLLDGAPAPGVRVSLWGPGGEQAEPGRTDDSGLGVVALPGEVTGPQWIVAEADGDSAVLPGSMRWQDYAAAPRWTPRSGWQQKLGLDSARFFALDDRHLYKPGETVNLKGWVRRVEYREGGGVAPARAWVDDLTWSATDPRGQEVARGTATLDRWGGFALSFELPAGSNLGRGQVKFAATSADGRKHTGSHRFDIQEFRRPEYEVAASVSEGPHLVGEVAVATVEATYYSGGALADAAVDWRVTSQQTSYAPPGHDDFVFGTWVPWWGHSSRSSSTNTSFSGRTDPSGRHRLDVHAVSVDPPLPQRVTVQGSVQDVNRQEWSASASYVLHPADTYVGLRTERTFLRVGQDLELDLLAVDIDGVVIAERLVTVVAERLQWRSGRDGWSEEAVDTRERTVSSAAEPVAVRFDLSDEDDGVRGGRWRVTARVHDDQGRPNQSQLTLWVAGGARPSQGSSIERETVELIPDKQGYADGEVAELLVLAPFAPAEGLLLVKREGHVERRRFRVQEGSTVLEVPIHEAYVPQITVEVQLVGASTRVDDAGDPLAGAPPRPAYAMGSLSLDVPPLRKVLEVSATPHDEALEPGGETVVDVTVVDADGEPVADGQVVVIVVDESLLALSGIDWGDPISSFHPRRHTAGVTEQLREHLHLAAGEMVAGSWRFVGPGNQIIGVGGGAGGKFGARAGSTIRSSRAFADELGEDDMSALMQLGYNGGGGPESAGSSEPPIRLRIDFSALALFETSAVTDADGRVAVPVTLPDSLTRYRVAAFATDGVARFGRGEAHITARLPLMVRPSAPRFLSWGDRFELPIVLQNGTDAALEVDLAVGATRVTLTGGAGLRVTVPAHDRVEVRVPAEATEVGTARMWIAAAAPDRADAAYVTVPVWTPATVEGFATYGTVDEVPVEQPVLTPRDVHPEFGGLRLTTSSTALASLTDAVLYLDGYPFACTEQLASRVLGLLSVSDVLVAFDIEDLPDRETLMVGLQENVDVIASRRVGDDGFRLWDRGDPYPFASLHATHALLVADRAGLDVNPHDLAEALAYAGSVSLSGVGDTSLSKRTRATLRAYASWVSARAGSAVLGDVRDQLIDAGSLDEIPLEACAWLLDAIADEGAAVPERTGLLRHLMNRASETAGAATFAESYTDGAQVLMHGARRTDALVLSALLAVDPDSDLVVKIVRGLQAHRTRGRWRTTQENCFVLLALRAYFDRFEQDDPDFVARAWIGDRDAGAFAFQGRDVDRRQLEVPMAELFEIAAEGGGGGRADLVLSKQGPGRLYYRLGLTLAPSDLRPDPAENGFSVERRYEAVEDPGDVWQDDDGVWHARAGAMVRVVVTLVAPARRYHVALVDPLPAGLEPLNPDLATTRDLSGLLEDADKPWWHWTWYVHDNLRDDRAEAFATSLPAGVYTYRYIARATTPGTFLAPPPRAEEMYMPETWGRGRAETLVVETSGR